LNRQRVYKFVFFGHWSKAKFVVKSGQVVVEPVETLAVVLVFSQRVLHKPCLPNKACSGRWGFCGIFGLFSTPKRNPALGVLSPPAPPPLTQTVRRFLLNRSKGVGLRREVVKVE
jgi:hypothetical protein